MEIAARFQFNRGAYSRRVQFILIVLKAFPIFPNLLNYLEASGRNHGKFLRDNNAVARGVCSAIPAALTCDKLRLR